MTAIESM